MLIACEHDVMRQCLSEFLCQSKDIDVVAVVANAHEIVQRMRDGAPNVMLLNLGLSWSQSLGTLELVLTAVPQIRVLAVGTYIQKQLVDRVIQAGVKGYMLYESVYEQLDQGIRVVADGRAFFCEKIRQALENQAF